MQNYMLRLKLGKKAPKRDPRMLMLASYLGPNLPAPPDQVDWVSAKIGKLGMMGNDSVGDCAIAAAGHQIQSWTGNSAGIPNLIPDSEILKVYSAISGYVPGNESTDTGCVEVDVLNYWRKNGIGGDKITAYTALQPNSIAEVMDAVWMFGGCYVGLALPISCQGQSVWSVPPQGPKVGTDGEPGSLGGHAVSIVAYTSRLIGFISWGKLMWMTYNFWKCYGDEAYAIISNDWVNKTGMSPSSFNMEQLQADLDVVTKL